ncbi:MAG: YgcG family protein [Spirulina sp. DLM2.Bin59]|nr:MAG: YgcG family protein [Spirulina sp. DLM2.Bin59]
MPMIPFTLPRHLRTALVFCGALVLSLTLWLSPATAATTDQLPSPTANAIIDTANLLSRINTSNLNKSLAKLATQTGQQVHFVTIDRLEYDDTIAAFSDRLFTQWFPTPEQQKNQTLLVLASLTNQGAIQTGASDLLTPEITTSITEDTLLLPLRRGGKYNQALLDAGDRLIAILSGQPDPGAPEIAALDVEATYATAEETDDRNATIWVVVLLVVATVVPMVTYFAYVGLPGR